MTRNTRIFLLLAAGVIASAVTVKAGLNRQNLKSADSVEIQTPALISAVKCGDITTVNKLITEETDVNIRDSFENTALHHAALLGHVKIAETLIDAGADVNAQNTELETPLFIAVKGKHLKTARMLIDRGANVHSPVKPLNLSLMLQAVYNNDVDMVKLLLKHHATPYMRDRYNNTALNAARMLQREEIVKVLEEAGVSQ